LQPISSAIDGSCEQGNTNADADANANAPNIYYDTVSYLGIKILKFNSKCEIICNQPA